ncbi:MAG TPA: flagellar M-ring protein FliF C-terminal domain-containing protein [Candidatus Gastranaerophilales bacterium]|nr:flagellar M-ring protein FliF C-terminal domain-containing protein [Candidatus Gastranaerophilales bacterium]
MDPNAILKNKNLLIGIISGVIVIVILVFAMGINKSSSEGNNKAPKIEKIKEDVKLLTTSDIGKALEIQAMLAREGITVRQAGKGTKIDLVLAKEDDITVNQRDIAIITIVKSGVMDKNIGLEIFDKGDFTSSREDKKIRLQRAINGELARLIKKIPGIEDASVFVAIPKDTIFTSLQTPKTATVQLVLPPDSEKLDNNVIRAVKNLLIGSVEDLDAENVSITDTNGNVYASIMNASDDMMKLLEDKDIYMKKKIIAQLDRLIGKGNYVVTVSTYLRETPLETDKVVYTPEESSVGSKQSFTENLGDRSEDKNKLNGAVSSYLPTNLSNPESRSNRNYTRAAEEYSYKVGQTRISELKEPGVLEEISIAVTISKGSLPTGMETAELKELIAKSASPKASANNVQIAFSDKIRPFLSQERPVQLPQPEGSGNPWWTVAAILGVILFVGLVFISGRAKDAANKHKREIDSIMDIAKKQGKAIEEATQKTAAMQQLQQQMYQQIATNQQQAVTQQPPPRKAIQPVEEKSLIIEEEIDDEELVTTLKSWIESSV